MRCTMLFVLSCLCFNLTAQYTDLDLSGLTTSNNINDRAINQGGTTTFDASATRVNSNQDPDFYNTGIISFVEKSGSVQCVNLTFSEVLDVRIINSDKNNGGTTNEDDSFYFDKTNYTEIDPSNRMSLVVTGGNLGLNPIDEVNDYSNWSLTFNDVSDLSVCALRTSGSANNNNSGQIRMQIVNATLPIELELFKGVYLESGEVNLEWKTLFEDNLNYIEVERSINGVEWNVMGEVALNVSYLYNGEYSFIDHSVESSQVYYRLKLVDINGGTSYSPVVKMQIKDQISQVMLYPNPVNHEIRVIGKRLTLESIRIYNLVGQRMNIGQGSEVNGGFVFDVRELPVGQYVIRGSNFVQRFVKQ